MSEPRFAAALLAAGLSSRMGGANKLLLPYRGRPLVAHGAEAIWHCGAPVKIIVTGRDGDAVAAAAGIEDNWIRVHNAAAQDGLASSLKCAINAAAGADALAVLLADMPGISAALLDRLFAAWTENAYALAPLCKGEMGNPVILSRAAMTACLALTGDRGAKSLIMANAPRVIFLETNDPGVLRDFDSAADFAEPAD